MCRYERSALCLVQGAERRTVQHHNLLTVQDGGGAAGHPVCVPHGVTLHILCCGLSRTVDPVLAGLLGHHLHWHG